jgi:hypothetical protein
MKKVEKDEEDIRERGNVRGTSRSRRRRKSG